MPGSACPFGAISFDHRPIKVDGEGVRDSLDPFVFPGINHGFTDGYGVSSRERKQRRTGATQCDAKSTRVETG